MRQASIEEVTEKDTSSTRVVVDGATEYIIRRNSTKSTDIFHKSLFSDVIIHLLTVRLETYIGREHLKISVGFYEF